MDVLLAGLNLDYEQIKALTKTMRDAANELMDEKNNHSSSQALVDRIFAQLNADNLTPETISAAYARISRDPRPVNQLREEARQRVGKARRSNKNIIFGLGHSSVAEHAVFNLDIIGITRYLSELIQSHRLCSFTEKSQRYIKLDKDFIVPEELTRPEIQEEFRKFTLRRFEDYQRLCEFMKSELQHEADLCGEDARYVLPLSVTTQMGMTVNARNLEKILQNAASSQILEFQEFGKKLFDLVHGIAPSIIKYTEGTRRFLDRDSSILKKVSTALEGNQSRQNSNDQEIRLIDVTPNGDKKIIRAFLSRITGLSIDDSTFNSILSDKDMIRSIILDIFERLEPWDSAPREFEFADVTFELIISAAAYAQMKRHRMASLSTCDYDSALDITIPPALRDNQGEAILRKAFAESNDIISILKEEAYPAHHYGFLSCNRRRIVMKLNVRELIHLSRLREDEHAQWDIRYLSSEMLKQAKKHLPLSLLLACGKHQFKSCRESLGLN